MPKKKKKKNFNFAADKKYPSLMNALLDTSLFDEEEGTFTDNCSRRRVFVHLVPAPWSRVIAYSLIYGFGVTIAQQLWVAYIGRPEWHAIDPISVKMAEQNPKKATIPFVP